jgi:two-component system, LuxR family, response regulator FixJ
MAFTIIYLIENDGAVRTAVQRLLMSLNRPVRTFASAEQFLQEVDRGAAGCLILDIALPGMTGLQLHERLNEAEWKLPVIFTTGHDDEQSRDLALRTGAAAYLSKPFDGEVLLSAVRSALASIPT